MFCPGEFRHHRVASEFGELIRRHFVRELPHVLSRGISTPPSGVRIRRTHQKAFCEGEYKGNVLTAQMISGIVLWSKGQYHCKMMFWGLAGLKKCTVVQRLLSSGIPPKLKTKRAKKYFGKNFNSSSVPRPTA